MTMWLEETVRRLRSGASVPLAALTANTAVRAARGPVAVAPSRPRAPGACRSPGCPRTPARRGRGAGRAGRRRAGRGARWRSRARTRRRGTPARRSARGPRGVLGDHARAVDRVRADARPAPARWRRAARRRAGTRRRRPPPRTTRRSRRRRRARRVDPGPRAASPTSSRNPGMLRSRLDTNPPLRPLGPWPQRPASSSTTRASGWASSTCQAVHSPV